MGNKVSSRQMRGISSAKTDLMQWGGCQKCGGAPIHSLTPGRTSASEAGQPDDQQVEGCLNRYLTALHGQIGAGQYTIGLA